MSRDNKGIKTRKNGNFGEEKYTESITRHLALKRAARCARGRKVSRFFHRQTDTFCGIPLLNRGRVRAKPLANAAPKTVIKTESGFSAIRQEIFLIRRTGKNAVCVP